MPRLKNKWPEPPTLAAPAPSAVNPSDYFDISAAAQYLSVTTWTIRRLMKSGDLPFAQIGKRFIVRKTDLGAVWANKKAVAA